MRPFGWGSPCPTRDCDAVLPVCVQNGVPLRSSVDGTMTAVGDLFKCDKCGRCIVSVNDSYPDKESGKPTSEKMIDPIYHALELYNQVIEAGGRVDQKDKLLECIAGYMLCIADGIRRLEKRRHPVAAKTEK